MDDWKIGIALFCGIAVAQSFFLGSYLIAKDRLKDKPTLFLSLLLLALAFRIGKSLFYYLLPKVALWGVAMGGAGILAIGPAFWLYTKSGKAGAIRQFDYLHFLPAILVFTLGGFSNMYSLVMLYRLGTLLFAIYLFASLWLYFSDGWSGNKNRFWVFFTSMIIICLTFAMQMLIDSIQWYTFGAAIGCVVLYGINFLIMKDQSILKTPTHNKKQVDQDTQINIANALDVLFANEKIYRQKGLTLSIVSSHLERPSYLISKVINHHYGLKFNEFVNKYRVEEVKKRLQDVESNPTIETIAIEVGFSSTSSLYHAFKKETDVTPQVFRKQFSFQ